MKGMGMKEDLTLSHSPDSVPLAVIAAAAVAGFPLALSPSLASGAVPFLSFPSGEKLHGSSTLLRYFGRVDVPSGFYGKDPISAAQGASKNLNLMEWDKLWTKNKKIIDPVCPRHTAVVKDGRVLFLLKNASDQPFVRILPRHKKFEGAGKKAMTFTKHIWLEAADAEAVTEGEEVTLMDWGNAIVEMVQKDGNGSVVGLEGRLHLEGSVKTTKLKLTWLPDFPELMNLSLIELDYLITKKKLEEEDDFVSVLNPTTRWEIQALGDANMRNLKRGEIIQLERKGYYICDTPYIRPSKPICLLAIPDGRQRPPPGELAPK